MAGVTQETIRRREYFKVYNARRRELAWPKCKRCKVIARRLPKIGCLECHAKKQPRRPWGRLESDMIELYAGKDDMPHLQLRIYHETGQARTRGSIDSQSGTMGIKVRTHQDGFTIKQLSDLTGLHKSTITYRIKKLGIENIGRGRIVLISQSDGERVMERYQPVERPSYSVGEVMAILGCQQSTIYKAFGSGLPSWKDGHTRRVCKATVDRAVGYLRDTGKLRVNWRLLAPV